MMLMKTDIVLGEKSSCNLQERHAGADLSDGMPLCGRGVALL